MAAVVEDVLVGREDAVGEPVAAQELPDILDRVEFGASGRQRQEGDVVWNVQLPGGVPAGLIEQEDGMGARGDSLCDLGEVEVHGGSVAAGHDHGGGLTLPRADGAEEIGRPGALILGRGGPGAAPGPASGDAVLLAYARLVLPPEFQRRTGAEPRPDRSKEGGEV